MSDESGAPSAQALVERWIEVLHAYGAEDAVRAAIADDAVVCSHQLGRSKPPLVRRGFEDVLEWLSRLPKVYRFHRVACGEGADPDAGEIAWPDGTPTPERLVWGRYRMRGPTETDMGDFEWYGAWTLGWREGRIVAVLHTPDDPPEDDDYWGYTDPP